MLLAFFKVFQNPVGKKANIEKKYACIENAYGLMDPGLGMAKKQLVGNKT